MIKCFMYPQIKSFGFSWREYSKKDSDNRDAETNTIDRFIENLGNTVIVTTNPFLVLCKDELTSTLWGFTNDTYSNMICQSNKKMLDKINAFQNQQ